mmetsp:Transcript_89841/g.259080  ORF Transcript_89841/g.259080 Transcript_89841/m.259080 type:complete len:214 (-) Transcript_89841:882-1523(-)
MLRRAGERAGRLRLVAPVVKDAVRDLVEHENRENRGQGQDGGRDDLNKLMGSLRELVRREPKEEGEGHPAHRQVQRHLRYLDAANDLVRGRPMLFSPPVLELPLEQRRDEDEDQQGDAGHGQLCLCLQGHVMNELVGRPAEYEGDDGLVNRVAGNDGASFILGLASAFAPLAQLLHGRLNVLFSLEVHAVGALELALPVALVWVRHDGVLVIL